MNQTPGFGHLSRKQGVYLTVLHVCGLSRNRHYYANFLNLAPPENIF